MGGKTPTIDGSINPDWLQQKSASDKYFTRIRAYYLPGPKVRADVQCHAVECVMPTRVPGSMNVKTVKEEFNPMIFCYFCDRTFHVGCYNLDSELLQEEKVPWRCVDCSANLQNELAVKYHAESGYKLSVKQRRSRFLRDTVIDKEDDSQFASDAEFETADKEAFRRRALQLAIHGDSVVNLADLDDTHSMEAFQFSIMRTKADELKAKETNKKLANELAVEQKRAREAEEKLRALEEKLKQSAPVEQQPAGGNSVASTILSSTSAGTSRLSTYYTSGNTTATNEQHVQLQDYRPEPIHINPWDETIPPATNNQTSLNDSHVYSLLNRLTLAQERAEERKHLEARRSAITKIGIDFNGDPLKWLTFKQDVERLLITAQYDSETVKLKLRGALKGDAFELVRDIFDTQPLDVIMDILKAAYGDEMMLIRKQSDQLRRIKFDSNLYRSEVIKVQAAIQSYFSACKYARTGYLNANELGECIFEQFNPIDKQRCKEFYMYRNPGATTIVICIQTVYDFLLSRLHLLDEAPAKKKDKPHQTVNKGPKEYSVNAGTVVKSNGTDKEGYKFELRDKSTAFYIGYDMSKVNELDKRCEICSCATHFTVQCPQYRAMDEEGRWKVINDLKLCRSCVLTKTHNSSNCDMKSGCGMSVNRTSRCSQKHHISIHNAAGKSRQASQHTQNWRSGMKQKRRSHTNANTTNATNKIREATQKEEKPLSTAVAFHALDPVEVRRAYDILPRVVNNNAHSDSGRTLKYFKIKFHGPNGTVIAYAVGDSGSEVTIVRNDLREALGIGGEVSPLSLQFSDSTLKNEPAIKFNMTVQGINDGCKEYSLKNCYGVDYLNLPHRSLDMDLLKLRFPYLKEAEFDSYRDEQPVMLIGSPHAYLMEGNGKLLEGGPEMPVAVSTKLGWTVYGGISSAEFAVSNIQEVTSNNREVSADVEESSGKVSNEQLSEMLDRFHSIESLGIKAKESQLTEDEQKAVELIKEEMQVLDDGTVEVPLIWNRVDKRIPSLPNNYCAVLKRQMTHEASLRRRPDHLKAFNDNVKELIELGFLRYATDDDMKTKWPNIWYLPMTLVVNRNKDPPKMRNVYDASAKFQSISLNDKLLKGPDLLVNILQPLLRMRMSKYAFTADVSKMFHMMKICKRDQQCQRVLWREDHNEPMKTLILDVMGFGQASSPFSSQFVKNWNADNWIEIYPDAAMTLKNYTYMDDVLTSEPTLEKAIEVAHQCIEICQHINWKLVSFQSNSVELLKALPPAAVKKDIIPLLQSEEENLVAKVLGCSWNTKSDCFEFRLDRNLFVKLVKDFDHRPTKRDQASTIARIYDSLGLISNFTILGKILLQKSWQAKLKWDDEIPVEDAKLWKQWLEGIDSIAKLQINRRYTSLNSVADADELQLHIFCDAGADAFCAVAYLVVVKDGRKESKIVMAKAKVTPLRLKTKTLICEMPRLELLSALIATRIGNTITSIYHQLKMRRIFWSDSEIVLRWILNPNHRLLRYAIAPVEEILEFTDRKEWRYVPTKLNPADLCTKFRRFDHHVASTTWLNGPEFIKLDEADWPKTPSKLFKDDSLMLNNMLLATLNFSSHVLPKINCPIANDSCIDNFCPAILASWSKLVRATARGLKIFLDGFIPLVKIKQLSNTDMLRRLKALANGYRILTPDDLERAEHFLFRKIQREAFAEEYKHLQTKGHAKSVAFQQLNVFIDQQGLMRINSRANLNSLTFPQQFAPVLPRKNALVSLLLMHYHQKYKHIAQESQIAEIRTKCWIPQLRTAMRSIKAKCNLCNLHNAKPYNPPMAPLPEYRIDPSAKPFEVTGIDVLGPIVISRKKVYILIFACALTRYVHLHILESLESLRVLEAIVVFWTSYGPVRRFVSDNGTNFKGAAKILQEDFESSKLFVKSQASILQPKLSEIYRVEWEFISAYAPWFGGLYERLIKEVKRALFETLNNRRLQKIELNIAIHETAHRLNCRPLVETSVDAADEEILTPHHLAKNRSGWPLLPGIHKNLYVKTNDKSLYRRGRIIADEIMRKFVAYHLPTLTRRQKWHKDSEAIKVDDLVLMIEPNQTRQLWQRGRVIKTHTGRDGNIRSADIQLFNGKIKENRAVRNLAKINISSHPADAENAIPPANENISQLNNLNIISLDSAVEPLFTNSFSLHLQQNLVEGMARQRTRFRVPKTPKGPDSKVLLLTDVPVNSRLSDLLGYLQHEYNSIIGVFRQTDYMNGIYMPPVYIYLFDPEEVDKLLVLNVFYFEGRLVQITDPDLIPGTVEFPVDVREGGGADIRGAPIPVGLFRVRVLPASTTFYLREMLWVFEERTRIAGIKLVYDAHLKKTRNFGMLATLTRLEMRDIMGVPFVVFGDQIVTDFTNRSQVLLPADYAHLFDEHRRCIWSRDMCRENRLCFDVYNGAHHRPFEVRARPEVAAEAQGGQQRDDDSRSGYTPPGLPPVEAPQVAKVNEAQEVARPVETDAAKSADPSQAEASTSKPAATDAADAGPSKPAKQPPVEAKEPPSKRLCVEEIASTFSGLSIGDDFALDETGKE